AIRVGNLPLPLSRFEALIEREVTRQGFPLHWETNEGEAIALVDVPSVYPGRAKVPMMVESITLDGEALNVAGQSGSESKMVYMPQGPINQVASLAGVDASALNASTVSVQLDAAVSPDGSDADTDP
ncbi:MAG: hypothetical protein AAGJ83_13410, partial [Planctomycetota bacterium]